MSINDITERLDRNDVTERMEDGRWSAKTNLLCAAGLCVLISWATYLGTPSGQAQAISSADSIARLAMWFVVVFVGMWLLGASLWVGLYAYGRIWARRTPGLTTMVVGAARFTASVLAFFAIGYVIGLGFERLF